MGLNRRHFIKKTGTVTLGLPWMMQPLNLALQEEAPPLKVHLFSKHLQFLSVEEAAMIAADLGFSGLDLTVRPKGHVLPQNIKKDLPKALVAIRNAGIECELITTAIDGAEKQMDRDIIQLAAENGVKFYRMNWLNYLPKVAMEATLNQYKEQLRVLSLYNKAHNIIGCYQNHAGTKVGSSYWEIKQMLEQVDPAFMGVQYDIRHAVVDGGKSWPNGFRLLKDQIKTIVIKDFKWIKHNGKMQLINVPLGEGMVDFKRYFQFLKTARLSPPVSLHLEYPLGGAEKGKPSISMDKEVVFDAMKRDLNRLHSLWKDA